MRLSTPLVLFAALLVAGLGVGGYLVGESEAPTAAEATDAREAAFAEAEEASQAAAAEASHSPGEGEGLAEGRERGERDGRRAGAEEGELTAGEELAAVEAEQAEQAEAAETMAGTTPDEVCADSLSQPNAYGQCLEDNGQDPGAPLTDYCAANPEIVAQAGYCPSLNE